MGIFRNPVATNVNIARYCNFALMFTIGCYYVGGTLVSTFQCDPIQKAYLDDLEGKCIDNSQFRVANAVINSVTSVLLVCLPFPALLMMERRNKEIWQFLALIGLGLM